MFLKIFMEYLYKINVEVVSYDLYKVCIYDQRGVCVFLDLYTVYVLGDDTLIS